MATDKFHPISLNHLLRIILNQYDSSNHILGIPQKLFFTPKLIEPFQSMRFNQLLETPIGVAAGPHTQLAQNIVTAWLTGARFIELKTVQTLDELEVSKPCIDMQDEGYNCEWSQELRIEQSFSQYLDAWLIIHILKDKLGIGNSTSPGVIFNMSVGYNMEGILKDNVQWFFRKMADASEELNEKIESIKNIYPNVVNIKINPTLSDNVTLSTMHGCPPDEIEKIGHYLLAEKMLHTAIKFNPTLIGSEALMQIMSQSGFETKVPEMAFEHDLGYNDALSIISNLRETAQQHNLQFSLKITNTLESVNNKEIFLPSEKMMYMSGRALHPISVNLAHKLQKDFDGKLDISFSGGADAENLSELVACGFTPVTTCSDILKPGGYGRLNQYIEELRLMFEGYRAVSINDYIIRRAGYNSYDISECILSNLSKYSQKTLGLEKYKKTSIHTPSIKTSRGLGYFDCIYAPCEDTCSTNQDIPNYNYHTAQCNLSKAGEIILQTNPFPQTTGMICDHLCQTKCTRINYDSPVLIREIKRYVAETAIIKKLSTTPISAKETLNKRVSVIGAGPAGLSCSYFLALTGFKVDVYETKSHPGGMISDAIPPFRLTDEALENDVKRIENLGVKIHYDYEVKGELFNKIIGKSDYLFIAVGAQKSASLNIEGIDANGVIDPLELLYHVKKGDKPNLGKRIAIIGGGNTAMDVARTVYRIADDDAKVMVLYRRTIKQMPADIGEIKAVMNEGIEIKELIAPEKINTKDGTVASLACSLMKLGEKDSSGRRKPEKIENSQFNLEVDTIIPAVGQELAFDFGGNHPLTSKPSEYETQITNVFLGGDALRGASTAINAIGDGRKVAQIIINKEGIEFNTKPVNSRVPADWATHLFLRTKKLKPARITETSLDNRKNLQLVSSTLTEDEVIDEAKRCLLCDEFCSICSTVCPNLANYTYRIQPVSYKIQKALKLPDRKVAVEDFKIFKVNQPYQILNIANFCNECGNCETFCPSSGSPFRDKPRVYLTKSSFSEAPEGYLIEWEEDALTLKYKNDGNIFSLSKNGNSFVFITEDVSINLNMNSLKIEECLFKDESISEITTEKAVEMSIIMKGAENLFFANV